MTAEAGIAVAIVVAAVVTAIGIAALARTRWAHRLADHPNARSLHRAPMPRIGGLGIAAGVAAGAVATGVSGIALALLGIALALMLVSMADDHRSLPASMRLAAHFAAAAVASAVAAPGASPVVLVAAVLTIAWMTNLYNFMDGADGLAGGMACLGFAAYAMAAWAFGDLALAGASAAVAAASAAFLGHNFPPARVFMGDAGSIPLGFLAAAFGLAGWRTGAWPAWFPALVFSPFIVDASVTLARRLAARERVWEAHRSHYYQRLVLSGWSQRRVALGAYALMAAAGASALAVRREGFLLQCGTIIAWAAVYALLLVAIDRRAPRKGPGGGPGVPGRPAG